MASLALETGPRTAPEHPTRNSGELIDIRAVAADLESLAKTHSGGRRELRSALAQRLKTALNEGRAKAEQPSAQGPARTALRRAAVPAGRRDHPPAVRLRAQASLSVAEPVRGRAHGGDRDRRLRPRAAGARLRHRSVVPLALQADRLGRVDRGSDPLLPVGHRLKSRPRHPLGRRMHPPGQGGHDHPHRHSGSALPARRPEAVRRADDALRQRGGAQHRRAIRRRQARRARGPRAPLRTIALSGRAEREGRQRRACAICTRCSGSPNTSTACASRTN